MRAHLLVNPRAGGGRRVAEAVRALRAMPELETHLCADPVRCPIKTREPGGASALIAVGGDGTVNRALRPARDLGLPLAIVPVGTANDLASALGIPRDLEGACRVIRENQTSTIDLVSVNGCLFATCGGLGVAARVAARANAWRERPGAPGYLARSLNGAIYPLAAAWELARGSGGIRLWEIQDDERHFSNDLTVLVANEPVMGGRYEVAPGACDRDGLLELCAVPAPRGYVQGFSLLREALRGRVANLPGMITRRTARATLVSEETLSFFGDGEVLCRGRVFRLRVLPRAITVIADPAGRAA